MNPDSRSVCRQAVSTRKRPLLVVYLLALVLSVGASPAWGQAVMDTILLNAQVIPADSSGAYSQPYSVFFPAADQATDIPATTPDTNDDDRIDISLNDIPKDGGSVGVVDWVLVQLRIVPEGGQVPDNSCRFAAACRDQVTVVSKAALLLSDGSVVDADNPAEDALTFDGVDFDPATQNLYIAINHRNHLAVMSGQVAEPTGADIYEYDFTDTDNASAILGEVTRGGNQTMAGGDAAGDVAVGALGLADVASVNLANEAARTGYLREDVDMTANMGLGDVALVNRNNELAVSRGVDF